MQNNDFDVFISYSSKDQKIADALLAYLEQQGILCWMAPRNILPGQPYAQAIIDAISQSKVFVLIFSAQSSRSQDVLQETDLAKNKKKVIIPVRIDDTCLEGNAFEYYLSVRQWIDVIPDSTEAFEALGKAIIPHLTPKEKTYAPKTVENPATGKKKTAEKKIASISTVMPPVQPSSVVQTKKTNSCLIAAIIGVVWAVILFGGGRNVLQGQLRKGCRAG